MLIPTYIKVLQGGPLRYLPSYRTIATNCGAGDADGMEALASDIITYHFSPSQGRTLTTSVVRLFGRPVEKPAYFVQVTWFIRLLSAAC